MNEMVYHSNFSNSLIIRLCCIIDLTSSLQTPVPKKGKLAESSIVGITVDLPWITVVRDACRDPSSHGGSLPLKCCEGCEYDWLRQGINRGTFCSSNNWDPVQD